jgi:hypothetical protein
VQQFTDTSKICVAYIVRVGKDTELGMQLFRCKESDGWGFGPRTNQVLTSSLHSIFSSALNIEAAFPSEVPVNVYQISRCHFLESPLFKYHIS